MLRSIFLGYVVAVVMAAMHSMHDIADGMALGTATWPSLVMLGQVGALEQGYSLLRRRNAPRWLLIVSGAVVSLGSGCLVMVLHFPGRHSAYPLVLSGLVPALVVAVVWMLVFRLPERLEEARLSILEANALRTEAELSRLRANLQPHFLLNTLNAIAGLLTVEPLEARRLLIAVADLLRDALDEGPEVRPLKDELVWLRNYAEILEVRHAGLLSFYWEIAPEVKRVELPRMLLQPLVENAVNHGVLRRPEGGRVTIRGLVADGTFRLEVEDNGAGLRPGWQEGLGLRLVRRRLEMGCPGSSYY